MDEEKKPENAGAVQQFNKDFAMGLKIGAAAAAKAVKAVSDSIPSIDPIDENRKELLDKIEDGWDRDNATTDKLDEAADMALEVITELKDRDDKKIEMQEAQIQVLSEIAEVLREIKKAIYQIS